MPRSKQPIWWQVFISEYLKNGQNGKLAYKKAKPNVKPQSAEVEASKLLRNPKFQEVMSKATTKAAEKIEMSRDEWLKLVADEARFDLRKYIKLESGSGDVQLIEDWDKLDDGHALQKISFSTTTQESGAVVQRVQIESVSKIKAQEIIGKALGYLSEKVEHSGSISVIDPYSVKSDDS